MKVSESACPFCAATSDGLRAAPGTNRRLTRAAAFAFSASLGAASAATGCASAVPAYGAPGVVDSGTEDTGAVQALYGAALVDAGLDGPSTKDSGPADASADAGPEDSSADAGETGIVPLYGAPAYGLPAPDAAK